MSVRKFNTVVLLALLAVVAAFVLGVGRRGLFDVIEPFHIYTNWNALVNPETADVRWPWRGLVTSAWPGTKAGRALAITRMRLPGDLKEREAAAARYVEEYRRAVREFPDLRPIIVPQLYSTAAHYHEEAPRSSPPFRAHYQAMDRILWPVTIEELTLLSDEEPDNSAWSILLHYAELNEAVREPTPQPAYVPNRPWTVTYEVVDTAALARVRTMVQHHAEWKRMDDRARERARLQVEALQERGFPPAFCGYWARGAVMLPVASCAQGLARRMQFLGYKALFRGDREEAHLWFDAIISLARSMLVKDASPGQAMIASTIANLGHDGLGDWYALQGDFFGATRHRNAVREASRAWEEYGFSLRAREAFIHSPAPKAGAFATAILLSAGTLAGAIVALVSWLVLIVWYALERREQRRHQSPVPDVPWGWRDALWAVAVAAGLIVVLVVVAFGAGLRPMRVEQLLPLIPAVLLAVPAFLAGVTCRRVWRRMVAAGGTGRASPLWTVLAIVMLITLVVLVVSGQPLPIDLGYWLVVGLFFAMPVIGGLLIHRAWEAARGVSAADRPPRLWPALAMMFILAAAVITVAQWPAFPEVFARVRSLVVFGLLVVAGVAAGRVRERLRRPGRWGRAPWAGAAAVLLGVASVIVLIVAYMPLSFAGLVLTDNAGPIDVGTVLAPLAVEAALAGLLAILIGALRRARGPQPWGERAIRTGWLVRTFAVATLVLTLAFAGSWPLLRAASDDFWRSAGRTGDAGLAYRLGPGWVNKYFAATLAPDTQPAAPPTDVSTSQP